MYKLLLCWRYLRTRYLAIVCIVSVMLGVATLIVVNSVMAGFSTKLKDRIHGLLSDVNIEAIDFEGFPDAEGHMRRIRESPIGQHIAAMSPTIETFAMLQYHVRTPYRDAVVTKTVRLIGVDLATRDQVGSFNEFIVDRQGRHVKPSFELSDEAMSRLNMRVVPPMPAPTPIPPDANLDQPPPPEPWADRPVKKPCGALVGYAIASFRSVGKDENQNPMPGTYKDNFLLEPGDEITLSTVSINLGEKGVMPVQDRFYVNGYFKSEMNESDGNHIYVPLEYLQKLRVMDDRVTSIQIRLKDYSTAKIVTDYLKSIFPGSMYQVHTWEEKQGVLLSAIDIERGILNVLLFMIVGVAGFSILAIFSMIVIEKTRDIGVLKALGASNRGILFIFLGYGLLLGAVGAGLGTVVGLVITQNLNEVEKFITAVTGAEIFRREIYYFDEIPTYVKPATVALLNIGSIAIAVIFSVLPALRAALLHPVRALRYE
jgi:lipoprotein-releasing system permease protein